MSPLVLEALSTDTGVISDSLADVAAKLGLLVCQLPSKAWEERFRRDESSSSEEETGTKSSNFVVFLGDCARNSGFPRTSHAVQPEDAALITLIISPCYYSLEDINSGIWKANGIMLPFIL